jgi:inorganic triphosphatase YgiF
VQTLKAEGASAMQRLEHNVAVPGARRPALDISRHDGTEAGAALRRALAGAREQPLAEWYSTDVQRTRRVTRHAGAQIELALDEGRLSAAGRVLPVCELEFELLAGPPQALLDLAARWVDRFGLVLDVRSKSERGHGLAAGLAMSPPTMARPVRLPPRAGLAQALAAMLANPLGQVLANASQMADGPAVPEHLHQLRVGLRRLRSVLQVFGPLLAVAEPGVDGSLEPALAALFGQLGAARDRDAMAEWLLPALQAAGAPPLAALAVPANGTEGAADLTRLLCAPATQRLWLAALGACQPPEGGWPDAAPTALKPALREPLRRLLRQVQRDAERFSDLDDEARHRLRRRIKRLRYAVDSVASLWPTSDVARLMRLLRRAQAPLGDFNDTVVALAHCGHWAEQDPHAWFAVGWLSARRQALLAPCGLALGQLARQGKGF